MEKVSQSLAVAVLTSSLFSWKSANVLLWTLAESVAPFAILQEGFGGALLGFAYPSVVFVKHWSMCSHPLDKESMWHAWNQWMMLFDAYTGFLAG